MLMQHDLTVGSHFKVIQYWSERSANKKMSKIWRPYLDDENVEEPGERNVEEIEKSGCVNSKTCMGSQLCVMCKKIVLNVNNYIEQTEGKDRGKATVKKTLTALNPWYVDTNNVISQIFLLGIHSAVINWKVMITGFAI